MQFVANLLLSNDGTDGEGIEKEEVGCIVVRRISGFFLPDALGLILEHLKDYNNHEATMSSFMTITLDDSTARRSLKLK